MVTVCPAFPTTRTLGHPAVRTSKNARLPSTRTGFNSPTTRTGGPTRERSAPPSPSVRLTARQPASRYPGLSQPGFARVRSSLYPSQMSLKVISLGAHFQVSSVTMVCRSPAVDSISICASRRGGPSPECRSPKPRPGVLKKPFPRVAPDHVFSLPQERRNVARQIDNLPRGIGEGRREYVVADPLSVNRDIGHSQRGHVQSRAPDGAIHLKRLA